MPMLTPAGRPFFLSESQLQRSLQADASKAAMEHVWSRLESGAPLRIGVLGSSVAMSGGCQAEFQPQLRCAQFDGIQVHKRFARGYGVVDNEMRGLLHNADRPVRGFLLQVLDWINATWPHRGHRIENAAVDAWTAKAIEPCLLSNAQLTSSDLLLLELGSQGWHSSQAAASERIIRKLVRLTSANGSPPAMVMVTTRQWCGHSVHGLRRRERPVILKTWDGIEDVFARFCAAYGMACLSMRDAIFEDVVARRANFTVPDVAADCLHPEQSRFGYHYMSDIIIHFLQRSWQQYQKRRSSGTRVRRGLSRVPLPPPLLEANRGRAGRMAWRCYELPETAGTTQRQAEARSRSAAKPFLEWHSAGGNPSDVAPLSDSASCDALRRCVVRSARTQNLACLKGRGHWQYCTRTLANRPAYKPGIVSLLPGAELRFVVDASAPLTRRRGRNTTDPNGAVLALTYLTSYEQMGVVGVSCEKGCDCEMRTIDALQMAQPTMAMAPSELRRGHHHSERAAARNVSVASVAELLLTQTTSACTVKLSNLARTRHGGESHLALSKWKLLQVRVGWHE